MKSIRVSCSPITGTIFAGRPNKDFTAWSGEKHDVTSDVLGAVIQKIGVGNVIEVHENGQPAYEIEVRRVGVSTDADRLFKLLQMTAEAKTKFDRAGKLPTPGRG